MAPLTRLVLLDRDGTLNVEKHYISDPQDVELYPGAGVAVRRLRALGFRVVVVTNQSPIGRGLFDLKTLAAIHDRLKELLAAENTELDGLFFCPHVPEDHCRCRKPKTGLLDDAAQAFGADLSRSFMVGDKPADIEAGRAAGTCTLLVKTGYGKAVSQDPTVRPDLVAEDLAEAARLIEAKLREEQA